MSRNSRNSQSEQEQKQEAPQDQSDQETQKQNESQDQSPQDVAAQQENDGVERKTAEDVDPDGDKPVDEVQEEVNAVDSDGLSDEEIQKVLDEQGQNIPSSAIREVVINELKGLGESPTLDACNEAAKSE